MKLLNAFFICAAAVSATATDLDTIGVSLLRQVDPTLNGSGVRVAQVENLDPFTPNSAYAFEVNPVSVGHPTSLFTWISVSNPAAITFPNTAGTESWHANSVGGNFYGFSNGVATNVAHVYNYEVNYFVNTYIYPNTHPTIPARIVNQSFTYGTNLPSVDQDYDDYASKNNTIILSGAGFNGLPIYTPATCYNGLGVSVYGPSQPPYGPTPDGRCKPDITAPGSGATSFSTPYVGGAAAVLLQAGTNSVATNIITVKALLLNGAIKPDDWTNGPAKPLDARYGAGIVNVFNSWKQLKGGKRVFIESTTVTSGNPHPPGPNTGNVAAWAGWDHNTLSASPSQDTANHYYFNLTNNSPGTFTATLVWNRQNGASAINNLDLFLYNTSNGSLVLSSTSGVDNVEHLYLPKLVPGRYDLQVLKRGTAGQVSTPETYALAFEFFCVNLKIARTNGNALLSWTNSPTGFRLVSTETLNPPAAWATVGAAVSMTNGQNAALVPLAGTNQFFRLQRP